MALLDIRNLTVSRETRTGTVKVLDRVNLRVAEGEIHTLIGESGSGKSLIARAIMGFLSANWQIQADRLRFGDYDLLQLTPKQRRKIIGVDIAMIFQDPASYLDPSDTIGHQLREAILKEDLSSSFSRRKKEKNQHVRQLLHRVGIQNEQQIMDSYPFELSEGEAQKVMIASALAHRPDLLIADEPTTTMEPATRNQIYRLLTQLNARYGMSILLITQDFGSVIDETHKITMIYSGQIMESGPANILLEKPVHPYTNALLHTSLHQQKQIKPKSTLPTLPGTEPTMQHLPIGCRLGPRCPNAQRNCVKTPAPRKYGGRVYSCHYPNIENPDKETHDKTSAPGNSQEPGS